MTRPDLHHELEQRLRADSTNWRAATTIEPDPQSSPDYVDDLHDLRHRRPSRLKARLAIAASVAAVLAAAIGVAVAAVSRTGPNHPPAGDRPAPNQRSAAGPVVDRSRPEHTPVTPRSSD